MSSQLVQQFEDFLLKNLPQAPSFHPCYEKALQDMLIAGGKRFRPQLLLTLVNHYEPLLTQNAFYPALGIELMHTYSLIHDDLPIVDNSPLRRGVKTLHVRYDDVTALLAGDALNTHAFYMISIAPFCDAVKIKLVKSLSLNAGASGMVLGQAIDCCFENTKIDYEQLKTLHVNKTAKLIASSLEIGAIISNLSESEISSWYDFGLTLGVLFQVQDDIIDVIGDEEKEGKPMHNDEDKNSFVNALGFDGALEEKKRLLEILEEKISQMPTALGEEFNKMINKYFKEQK